MALARKVRKIDQISAEISGSPSTDNVKLKKQNNMMKFLPINNFCCIIFNIFKTTNHQVLLKLVWFCLLFLLVAADFVGEVKREGCACCWVYLLFAVVISTCHHHIFHLCKDVAC